MSNAPRLPLRRTPNNFVPVMDAAIRRVLFSFFDLTELRAEKISRRS
jgi:hypothetical protein